MHNSTILVGVFIFLFTAVPTFCLDISILGPVNSTYNTSLIELIVENNPEADSWWYNLNDGGNTTFSSDDIIIARYGVNRLIVYANDSSGNTDSAEVTFSSSNYIDNCSLLNEPGMTYYLNDNISSSAEYCINISRNNILLDCRGHSITGNWYGIGIDIERSVRESTNIRLENCILEQWNNGINMYNSDNNQLVNLTANSNINGIYLSQCNGNSIRNSIISDNDNNGIFLEHSSGNNMKNITTTDNGGSDGYGILLDYSDNNTLTTVTNSEDYGTYIAYSANNRITGLISTLNEDMEMDNSENITFKDSVIRSNGGIYFSSSHDIQLLNVTIESANTGITFDTAYNCTITNSIIQGINGIYIIYSSDNPNWIYNNLINSTIPIAADYATWNATRQTGSRIFSPGTEIGGNYWTSPAGNGYSDTCTDNDHDGFCDEEYSMVGDTNIDYLPLSNSYLLPADCSLSGISNHYTNLQDVITCSCSGDGETHLYMNGGLLEQNSIQIKNSEGTYLWTCNTTTGSQYRNGSVSIIQRIDKPQSSGGGCVTVWRCGNWTSCVSGKQTQICQKENMGCYIALNTKPAEEKNCSVVKKLPLSLPENRTKPGTQGIPEQLFDIRLELVDNKMEDAKNLIAKINLESFGTDPVPASLTYTITDPYGHILYEENENITVYSQENWFKNFRNLSLTDGKYILAMSVRYANITEYNNQTFVIESKTQGNSPWLAVLTIFLCIPLLFMVRYHKKKLEKNRKR